MASELQIRTRLITESRFDKNKIDGLPRIGQYAVEKIRTSIIEHKITASGRTQSSIAYKIDGEKQLRIIAEAGKRAPISTLQYGREPGRVPRGFVEIIKQWIKDKRITYRSIVYKRIPSAKWQPKYTPEERGLNSAAGAIAHKIKVMGTNRHLKNDTTVYSPVLDEVVELFTQFIANKATDLITKRIMQ